MMRKLYTRIYLRWENRQEARPEDEGALKRSGFLHSLHANWSLPSQGQ